MKSLDASEIKITLVSSYAGQSDTIRKTFRSLGLTKIGSSRILPNVNTILGQVNKVIQFVKVEAVK
jgi:large subunit ribosomal protein L30